MKEDLLPLDHAGAVIAPPGDFAQPLEVLQQLLASTDQGCWFLDAAGLTTEVNAAMCRLLGRPREQILGRPATAFFDGEELAALMRQLEARRQGAKGAYELQIRRPDGTRVHCLNNASPLWGRDGGFMGSVGLWTDVSASMRDREALAESAEYLRGTLEATGDAIFASDAADPRQPVRFANAQLLRMWGIAQEKAATLTPADIMAAALPLFAEPEIQLAHVAAVIAGNVRDESRVRLRDGRVLLRRCEPARIGTQVVRVWSFRDITAEERSLHLLQEREAEQRALLDAFPGYISRLDASFRYTYVNHRVAALLGREVSQVVGRSVDELLPPERVAVVRANGRRALAGEVVLEEHVVGPRPQRRHLQTTLARSFDPRGTGWQLVAYGVDVTARVEAQHALRQARDEAESANRAKSQFLAHMSHELRTPLNAIVGFAQLLQRDARAPLATHQLGYVREMLAGAHHLLDLINEVLDLGSIEAGRLLVQMAPVALDPLLHECLSLVRPLAATHAVQLVAPPADGGLRVQADRVRLKQVLINLLGNAVKYNRRGGEVRLLAATHGERIRIDVSDTGPGLDAAACARLFRPFERLGAERTAVEGTGIGLAISRRLAQAMGGELGVTSEPGRGSTFWVEVAPAALPAAAGTQAGHDATADDRLPRPVLYVDDNLVNLVLMEAMLQMLPQVRLLTAEDAVAGLQQALRETPALVLLDIQLPGMDGYEMLARLRAAPATAAIPVVAVSANAMPADIEAAHAAGFADYLTKPLDLQRLHEVVRHYLRLPAPAAG